jgi:uncharacterized membrane protein YsdA (DUF1294 family)
MASRLQRAPTRRRAGVARYLPVVLFLIGYLVVNALWPIPLWVAGLYLVASIVCFIVYAVDKSAARGDRRRVPEKTLLGLGVIGGWPGAIVAQQTLRHKTQKVSFRRAFWATVAVNVVVFAVFATPVFALLMEWTKLPAL